jgi:lysophospholipase L1-like esterase
VKAAKPDYTYGDGVHPPADGHLAMAIGILEGLGQSPAEAETILTQLTGLAPADKTVAPTGPQGAMASKLLDRFNQRSAAYRKAIGVPAPMTANAPPLDEADRAAADARVELRQLIAAAYQPPAVSQTRIDQANKKWAEEIAKLEARDKSESYPDDAILFIGSSSIRMWKGLDEDIAPYRGINRGYGGARYSDLAVFAQRLITPHKYAAAVVFVANDIVGKPADTPLDELDRLVRHIIDVSKKHQPDAPVLIVEITPTESRFAAYPQIRKANFVLREIALTEPGVFLVETNDYYLTPDRKPIADYFLDDRLHQNPTGYELWGSLIKRELDEVLASRQSGRMRPVEDLAPATP